MSEMVERVVRAMNAEIDKIAAEGVRYDKTKNTAAYKFERCARAAIEALRHPTDKMICAALDAHDRGKRGYSDIWNSMVDGALR